jgi:hypothetical protein
MITEEQSRSGPHQGQPVLVAGEQLEGDPLEQTHVAMVLLHGRGATAHKSNGTRWSGPVMRAERKRGKIRPGGTIARAGMRSPFRAPRPVLLAVAWRNRRRRGSRCSRVLNARQHDSAPVRLFELKRGGDRST